MVDRIIDLPDRAEASIRDAGFGWYLDGDNHDYLTTDVVMVSRDEGQDFIKAAEECYQMYVKAFDHVFRNNLWSRLGLPDEIIPLIKHDWQRALPLLCGRLDLAGGIEDLPIKLIEFNADTCTSLPESAYFQDWMQAPIRLNYKGQINYLVSDLTRVLRNLKIQYSDRPATLLLTSLGYVEDQLNLEVIKAAGEEAGFAVDYADLKEVVFSEDGVFLEDDKGEYIQYHFVYKLVPWEFIMFEEPELLQILTDLSINQDLIVLNPAYSIAFQAKHMMSIIYELFPDHPLVLPTYDNDEQLRGQQHVKKVNFGRLGENVSVIDPAGKVVSENDGDFGSYSSVYQAFTPLYADEDGDLYQGAMFLCDGNPSCLSFRRRDGLIIDDDCEFIPHILF